ncbi:MAG TPA: preprotein translocase subunit SecG [Deltaproteobacteria bacterium]|nr:MAG: preprotein translocase subunit SecG [Deltaproteobacteria bacterium GWA2_45_12]HBF12005.1 preprotein translocase subunit SecG [Deltaproteobacteria bacterium]
MEFLQTIEPVILVVHYLISIFLIIVILLQAGKGGDMGSAFGAGGSQSLFGVKGASTLLSKTTTVAAFFFLITSLSLSSIKRNDMTSLGGSVLDKMEEKKEEAPPIAPENKEVPPVPAN